VKSTEAKFLVPDWYAGGQERQPCARVDFILPVREKEFGYFPTGQSPSLLAFYCVLKIAEIIYSMYLSFELQLQKYTYMYSRLDIVIAVHYPYFVFLYMSFFF
jgi:hypothetical protein